jgi:hypothetical protein
MMLYVYDVRYELVDQTAIDIPLSNKNVCALYAVDSDYLLFASNPVAGMPDYYIDKSQIGTGNMEFVKMD